MDIREEMELDKIKREERLQQFIKEERARVLARRKVIVEKSAVTDVPLKDLTLKDNLLLCFINRNGRIIIPSGNDSIQKNDTVMIITKHTGFNQIQDILK